MFKAEMFFSVISNALGKGMIEDVKYGSFTWTNS